MSTPRKSTSSNPRRSTGSRPCTPESLMGRSPRAPGPPSSPDRRSNIYIPSPDRPTKSYLRPTVSSTLHLGNSSAPRRSTDRPPFLPPSSVGVNSVHHKSPYASKGTGSLSLKSILTKANNALKAGRKSSGGFGSTSGTPIRPRSPALVKKKEQGSKSYARSNSVPKKMEVMSTTRHEVEETETVSIHSIEDRSHEQFANPIEPTPIQPRDHEFTVEPTPVMKVEVEEPVHNEKSEEVVSEVIGEGSVVAIIEKPVEFEEKHEEVTVEEIEESSMENVKVIEECREEEVKVEEEVEEKIEETKEEVVIVETEEEEVPKVEETEIVKDMNQENVNDDVIHQDEEIKEPELMAVKIEEEIKDEKEPKEESQEKEVEMIMTIEAPKEEQLETPIVETETNVENVITQKAPKEEETKIEQIAMEKTSKEQEKPTTSETVEKKENPIVVEAPKVEKKPARFAGKKPDAVAAKKEGGISNDVIEETRSKLMEKRKNKVLALVGAFETVMQ